ncbi:MAG: transcription antitermination factor NusB [Myxococcota bacterium]
MSRVSPARLAAARALVAVEEGAHLDAVLAEMAPATGADRDLSWFLAFGVTRRRGEVDAALRPRLSRPLTGLDPAVRAVLRLGAFERLFARTKPHAVVHQAVEVMKALGPARASGMVNAVVRRVERPDRLRDAEAHNLPDWLWARWVDRHGADVAGRWAEIAAEPPPLFVVATDPTRPLDRAPAGLVTVDGIHGVARCDAPSSRIEEWPGYADGSWWIQDLAAVQMADLVGTGPSLQGRRVLDAFAAPGGKAFRLASQGARVVAVDRDPERLEKVRSGAERLGLDLDVRTHDWSTGPDSFGADFDAVLVDAPCSALGTLRRHPEVRWRRQPDDLDAMGARQSALLETVATLVRPGGILVYAVCSPEPEEGESVVERFLEAHRDFAVDEVRQTAPPQHGEDAHYGCRLRRTEDP